MLFQIAFSDWISFAELLVGIIGLIVGVIGGKELHEANKLKIQIKKLEAKIEKIEITNSQVANTINNNGLNVADTEYLAEKVVATEVDKLPKIRYGTEPPGNSIGKNGDIYMQIIE